MFKHNSDRANMGAAVNKLFDLVMQVEHSHPDSIVIVTGDFSKADLKKEMPKFIQQVTCATRYGRTFDYCYNLTIIIQPTFKRRLQTTLEVS